MGSPLPEQGPVQLLLQGQHGPPLWRLFTRASLTRSGGRRSVKERVRGAIERAVRAMGGDPNPIPSQATRLATHVHEFKLQTKQRHIPT